MASAGTGPDRVDALRRLGFTILSPSMSRNRRARLADSLARAALDGSVDPAAARRFLVSSALHVGSARLSMPNLGRARAETPARAVERALAAMAPAARAAFALLHLERLSPHQVEDLLATAGVPDPQTAVALAERTALDPAAVRALALPAPTGAARTRLVAAGAIVVVVGLAAPVLATTAGGGDAEEPSPQAPAAEAVSPVQEKAVEPPAKPAAAERAVQPAPRAADQPGEEVAEKQAAVERDLTRILLRLEQQLGRRDVPADEVARLRTLRAAVLAEQERLQRAQTR